MECSENNKLIIPFYPIAKLAEIREAVEVLEAVPAETYFSLRCKWESFQQYLDSLSASARRSIRREIRIAESLGISFSRAFGSRAVQNVLDITQLSGLPRRKQLLEMLLEEFQSDLIAFTATDDDGLRACCLAIKHDNELYLRIFQRRADIDRDNASYFNVCYYEPIKYSIDNNLRVVNAGIGAGGAKIYRGFEPIDQQTVIVSLRKRGQRKK